MHHTRLIHVHHSPQSPCKNHSRVFFTIHVTISTFVLCSSSFTLIPQPENVLLAANPDRNLVAKVCDFGIAGVLEYEAQPNDSQEAARTIPLRKRCGTPGYCPPQAYGAALHGTTEGYTEKYDLFGVGVTLCHVMNGKFAPGSNRPSTSRHEHLCCNKVKLC